MQDHLLFQSFQGRISPTQLGSPGLASVAAALCCSQAEVLKWGLRTSRAPAKDTGRHRESIAPPWRTRLPFTPATRAGNASKASSSPGTEVIVCQKVPHASTSTLQSQHKLPRQSVLLPCAGKDIRERQAGRELPRNRAFCFCSGTDKSNFEIIRWKKALKKNERLAVFPQI